MALSSTGNILTTGSLDSYIQKAVDKNYQDKRFFMQFGTEHVKPQGVTSWTLYQPKDMSGTTAALTEGVTPDSTAFTITPVVTTLTQYGARVELSDMVMEDSPVDVLSAASEELGNDLARKVDIAYQDVLDAGTNIIYSAEEDSSAGRTNVDDGDILSFIHIAEASSKLRANDAPMIGQAYVAVMHPLVYHDLMAEVATGGFVDVNKYSNATNIFKGEVGMLYGVRIVVSSNVQYYANASNGAGSTGTVDVYPTYVFGEGAFHHCIAGGLQTFYSPLGTGDDYLRQRANVSTKTRVGFKIVRPEGLYRIESASSLGANAS